MGLHGVISFFFLIVNMVLRLEEDNPKCFLNGTLKIFCFWEEKSEDNGTTDQYTFRYTYP